MLLQGTFTKVQTPTTALFLGNRGSGKTVAMKLEVLRGVPQGMEFVVVDPKGEYVGLAERMGGHVLESVEDHSTVDLEGPIAVLNLKGCRIGEKRYYTTNLLAGLLNLALDQPRPRVLVIDECMPLIRDEGLAGLLTHAIRDGARHNLSIMVSTGKVSEFLSERPKTRNRAHQGLPSLSYTLVSAAKTIVMFRQDSPALRWLAGGTNTPREWTEWLRSCSPGEGLALVEDDIWQTRVIVAEEEQEFIICRR